MGWVKNYDSTLVNILHENGSSYSDYKITVFFLEMTC